MHLQEAYVIIYKFERTCIKRKAVNPVRKGCVLLLALVLLCGTAFAVDSLPAANEATITMLEGTYTFAEDGSCAVQLTVSLQFSAGVSDFSLPLPGSATEVAVSGQGYTSSRTGDTLVLNLHAAGQLADQTMLISYRLLETTVASDDGQLCTLPLLQATRACPIESYHATITLPAAFEEKPVFESFYYQDLIESYLEIQYPERGIEVQSLQPLRDHEPLTMTLALPAGYFDLRFLAGRTATPDILLFWVFVVLGVAFWAVFLRNRLLLPKASAMPPLSGNAGAVPYLLTGADPDPAIMVLYWASLGYLSVTRLRSGKLRLTRQIEMGTERRGYEMRIFRSLFDRGDERIVPSAAFRAVRDAAPDIARGHWEQRLFVPHHGHPRILRVLGALAGTALCLLAFDRLLPAQSGRWFAILPLTALGFPACLLLQPAAACFLQRRPARILLRAAIGLLYLVIPMHLAGLRFLTWLCVLFQLLIGLALTLGGRRTKGGMRHAEAMLGLRRYLRTEKTPALHALLAADPQYFYRTLPYADALRVGGSFARHFDSIPMEPCVWLTAEGRSCPDAESFYRLYRQVLDTLREQTDTPILNLLRNLLQRRKAGGNGARSPLPDDEFDDYSEKRE